MTENENEGAIATIPSAGELMAQPGKYATDVAVADVAGSGGFMGYIQLMSSNSECVKRGQFPLGHFSYTKGKNNHDLGESFQFLVFGWRPRAINFNDNISVFDTEHPEFKALVAKADLPGLNGAAYGMEFLIGIPDVKELALFHFGNKSSRNEAPALKAILTKQIESGNYLMAKVKAEIAENKKKGYLWHVPVVTATDSAVSWFPDVELLKKVLNDFNNPPAITQEITEGDTRDR